MSAGIYANINGVTRKGKKLYAKVNGVTRPIKEMWVKVNGVSRCVYKNAITWTVNTASVTGTDPIYNSSNEAAWFGISVPHIGVAYSETITYTFDGDGLLMHAGQTIRAHLYWTDTTGGRSKKDCYIRAAGEADFSIQLPSSSGNSDDTEIHTFTSDTLIKEIKISMTISSITGSSGRIGLGLNLDINSDYGSFYLGSTCTSDQ